MSSDVLKGGPICHFGSRSIEREPRSTNCLILSATSFITSPIFKCAIVISDQIMRKSIASRYKTNPASHFQKPTRSQNMLFHWRISEQYYFFILQIQPACFSLVHRTITELSPSLHVNKKEKIILTVSTKFDYCCHEFPRDTAPSASSFPKIHI